MAKATLTHQRDFVFVNRHGEEEIALLNTVHLASHGLIFLEKITSDTGLWRNVPTWEIVTCKLENVHAEMDLVAEDVKEVSEIRVPLICLILCIYLCIFHRHSILSIKIYQFNM